MVGNQKGYIKFNRKVLFFHLIMILMLFNISIIYADLDMSTIIKCPQETEEIFIGKNLNKGTLKVQIGSKNNIMENSITDINYNKNTGILKIIFKSNKVCNKKEELKKYQEYQESTFCCGDNSDESQRLTDCGNFISSDKAICWKSNDKFKEEYKDLAFGASTDFPKTDIKGADFTEDEEYYQWYWTRPEDADNLVINISCMYSANTLYSGKGCVLTQIVNFTHGGVTDFCTNNGPFCTDTEQTFVSCDDTTNANTATVTCTDTRGTWNNEKNNCCVVFDAYRFGLDKDIMVCHNEGIDLLDIKQEDYITDDYKENMPVLNMYSDGTDWVLCDAYALSITDDGSFSALYESVTKHFFRDSPYTDGFIDVSTSSGDAQLYCISSYYDSDKKLKFIENPNNPDEPNPTIAICNADTGFGPTALGDNYFGGKIISAGSDTKIPYFGEKSEDIIWGRLRLSEFFKPDPTSSSTAFFPRFNNLDSLAYIPSGYFSGNTKISEINSICNDKDCLIATKNDIAYIYNSIGEIRKFNITSKLGINKITAMTFIGKDNTDKRFGFSNTFPDKSMLFWTDGNKFYSLKYDQGTPEEYNHLGEFFTDCSDMSGFTPSKADFLAYSEAGYFENLYPKLIFGTKSSSGEIFEIEYTQGFNCSIKTLTSFYDMGNNVYNVPDGSISISDIDSFEAISLSTGNAQWFLPLYTPAYFMTIEDTISMMYAAPLSCFNSGLDSDLDGSGSFKESLCNSYAVSKSASGSSDSWTIGGYYDTDGETCCGEPEDPFETYFSKKGMCFKGIWFESNAGTTSHTSTITNFIRDPYLNSIKDTDFSNELKELIMIEGSTSTQIKGCAVQNDDLSASICNCDEIQSPNCCNLIENMGNFTKPYQGNTTLLYNWKFSNNNKEPWETPITGIDANYNELKITIQPLTEGFAQHYMHNIRPNTKYNFRIKIKPNSNAGIGDNITLYFKENSNILDSEVYTFYHTDFIDAMLVFTTPNDIIGNEYYVGYKTSGSNPSNYVLRMKSPRLASNDYLLDIKAGDSSFDGKNSPLPTDSLITNSAKYCELLNINTDSTWDYYCGFEEVWKKVPSEIQEMSEYENDDFVLKFIPEEVFNNRETKYASLVDKAVQIAGCCLTTQCWNGTACIESDHNEGRPILYPNASSRIGYRCMHGNWTQAHIKWPSHNEDNLYGYCEFEDQCLVDINGNYSVIDIYTGENDVAHLYSDYDKFDLYTGDPLNPYPANTKSQNPLCINDGQYIRNSLCDNGNWTTRTFILAEKMSEMANEEEYTLFCDKPDNTLNTFIAYVDQLSNPTHVSGYNCNDFYINTLDSNPERYIGNAYIKNEFSSGIPYQCLPATYYRDSDLTTTDNTYTARKYPQVESFCVLKWKDGSDLKVTLGAVLNQDIDDTNFPFKDLLMHTGGASYCTSTTDAFVDCSSTSYFDVKYNRPKKLVIFAEKNQGFPTESTSLISIIKTKLQEFFNLIFNTMGSIDPTYLEHSSDYSRIYMSNYDTDKKIYGGISESSTRNLLEIPSNRNSSEHVSAGNIYTNAYLEFYLNDSNKINICNTTDEINSLYWNGHCFQNTANTTMGTDNINFYDNLWIYITARLRPLQD
jgi:hypothetical protein